MATTTTTTTDVRHVRWSSRRELRILAAVAILASGLAVWTGGRSGSPVATDDHTDPAAVTAGLSQELLADELSAIRSSRVSGTGSTTEQTESGLSGELLNEELAAIRRTTASRGVSTDASIGSGLSRELLAEELAAIHEK
ncbi:MAG: hypothetical protein OES24_05790 [Acidimicrobiia bacterium]|nr:hypothetical protein [Acidimicrobiia bacterium]